MGPNWASALEAGIRLINWSIAWQLLEHPDRDKYDLSSISIVGYGGAPSAPALVATTPWREDGRVYVHWDFYNNERQCGTFNAEPYILPMPERKAPPAPGPCATSTGTTRGAMQLR